MRLDVILEYICDNIFNLTDQTYTVEMLHILKLFHSDLTQSRVYIIYLTIGHPLYPTPGWHNVNLNFNSH